MSLPTFTHPLLLIAMCLAAVGALTLGGCEKPAAAEPEHVLRITVGGMHCDGCAGTVRSEVSKMDGVRACRVSLEEELAVVEVDDPALAQAIIERIESLDFTARLQRSSAPPEADASAPEDFDDPAEEE